MPAHMPRNSEGSELTKITRLNPCQFCIPTPEQHPLSPHISSSWYSKAFNTATSSFPTGKSQVSRGKNIYIYICELRNYKPNCVSVWKGCLELHSGYNRPNQQNPQETYFQQMKVTRWRERRGQALPWKAWMIGPIWYKMFWSWAKYLPDNLDIVCTTRKISHQLGKCVVWVLGFSYL